MSNYVKLVVLGIIALVAAMGANWARDLAYQVHAVLIMVIATVMFLWVLRQTDEPQPVYDTSGYMDNVVPRRRNRHGLLGLRRFPGRSGDCRSTGLSGAQS